MKISFSWKQILKKREKLAEKEHTRTRIYRLLYFYDTCASSTRHCCIRKISQKLLASGHRAKRGRAVMKSLNHNADIVATICSIYRDAQ